MSELVFSVDQALAWAADQLRAASPTPRLDAELLLAHILGWARARVLAERRHAVDATQSDAFRALVARRFQLEPVAYLTGHKEFYGLDFAVDRRVLVPRPETELLVELALAHVRRWTTDHRPPTIEDRGLKIEDSKASRDETLSSILYPLSSANPSEVGRQSSVVVADIGTGSGCIAVAVAVHVPEALIVATDSSREALDVARLNVARHGVAARVQLREGDLLAPLEEPVDVLISNPPYTILAEIDEGVRRHEPRGALDGGPDGLAVYRRLLAQAPAKIRPGGAALLEIGATQGEAVAEIARAAFPTARVEIHQDLAGFDRVVEIVVGGNS